MPKPKPKPPTPLTPPAAPILSLNGKPIRLDLHLHIHMPGAAGNQTPPAVNITTQQSTAQAAPHAIPAQENLADAQSHLDTLSSMQLLAFCGVRTPLHYDQLYPPERIRTVVKVALSKHRNNLGGFVATALTKGWYL